MMNPVAFVLFLIQFFGSLALSVTQIVMGIMERDNIDCDGGIVRIEVWLIVMGGAGVLCLFLLLLIFLINVNNERTSGIFGIFGIIGVLMLIGLFELAWLIIGAITFWRDCIDVGPYSINILMWVSLIAGFVFVLLNARFSKN